MGKGAPVWNMTLSFGSALKKSARFLRTTRAKSEWASTNKRYRSRSQIRLRIRSWNRSSEPRPGRLEIDARVPREYGCAEMGLHSEITGWT